MKHCPESQKLIASKCNQSTQLFTTGESPSVEKIVGTKIVGVLNIAIPYSCGFSAPLEKTSVHKIHPIATTVIPLSFNYFIYKALSSGIHKIIGFFYSPLVNIQP